MHFRPPPPQGVTALRRGRFSNPGASYFITFCTATTATNGANLTLEPIAASILAEAKKMNSDETWILRGFTIMPDHIHALITLGNRLPLDKAINRLKAKTSALLRKIGMEWERGFFDHKLRENDSVKAILRYIYLNPYRTTPPLIRHEIGSNETETTQWAWFYCAEQDWGWFKDTIEPGVREPDWIRDQSSE